MRVLAHGPRECSRILCIGMGLEAATFKVFGAHNRNTNTIVMGNICYHGTTASYSWGLRMKSSLSTSS